MLSEYESMFVDMECEEEIEELKPHVGKIREEMEIAEALARTSLLTPASATARLAARRLQFQPEVEFMPPRMVLLYLVRTGSFQSSPKILNEDKQDEDFQIPAAMMRSELLALCRSSRSSFAKLMDRNYHYDATKSIESIGCDSNKTLKDSNNIRVMQWNLLSQTLGQQLETFVNCPSEALEWNTRKYSIIEEIVRCDPDIICLQEVDHFSFMKKVLNTQGYTGCFFVKPDSPCLYMEGNNGPDGCAIFYKENKYTCIAVHTKILEVWKVKSNQVAIVIVLKSKNTNNEFCVATTHLKARRGALLAHLRDEQARDLLRLVSSISEERPVIICGDFNGEPSEPFYKTMHAYKNMNMVSSYASYNEKNDFTQGDLRDVGSHENTYTTWKVRETGEECHTIDYIFYTPFKLNIQGVLQIPSPDEMGNRRLPSFNYPSDHFSLAADFSIF